MHQFLDDGLRETLANGCPEIGGSFKGAAQSGLAAEFFDHGLEFVDHSVIYCSAKWRASLGPSAPRYAARDADEGQASEQARDESKLPSTGRPNKYGQTGGRDEVEHEDATVGLGDVSRACLGLGDAGHGKPGSRAN